MSKILLAIALGALSLSGTAFAEWELYSEGSQLNFLSVKKGTVIESHHFEKFSGSVSDAGEVMIDIDLASVQTGIDIRNERMQGLLFNVPMFRSATATASIDVAALENLSQGQRATQKISLELDLHGIKSTIDTTVYITSLGKDAVAVATVKPIVLSADDFELGHRC